MNEFNQHVRFTYIVKNIRKVQRLAPEQSKFAVLDVGSGPGTLSEYLLSELSAWLVKVEIQRQRKLGNPVLASGVQLPFRDGSFDFVVSTDVLEHIRFNERETFVKELLRCSRTGLVITYSNINRNSVSQCGIKIFERLCFKWPDWYLEHNANRIVDYNDLSAALDKQGAQTLNQKRFGGVLTLFFTGLTHSQIFPMLNHYFNFAGFIIARCFDFPPYHNRGITVQKSCQEKVPFKES